MPEYSGILLFFICKSADHAQTYNEE